MDLHGLRRCFLLFPPPPSLPSYHSAPSVLPTAADFISCCVSVCFETVPIVAAAAPAVAPAFTAPRSSHQYLFRPHTLVAFHDGSSLVIPARTSHVLRDVDSFERRRLNERNSAKHSKRNRTRERDEAHLTVGGAHGFGIVLPGLQSGVGSPFKPGQPNESPSPLVKSLDPPSSTGGPATVHLSSNNKNPRPKFIPNGLNGKASTPATTQVQSNGAADPGQVRCERCDRQGCSTSPSPRQRLVSDDGP